MIQKQAIIDFFDLEAEAARSTWEATMRLPLKERVRKRKAIASVYVSEDFEEQSPEGEELYKLSVKVNLSDFKEGECLLLHEENQMAGQKCTLYRFEGENNIIVSVFPLHRIMDIKKYCGRPMVLDRDLVDLREFVFHPFATALPEDTLFWRNQIINSRHAPTFRDRETCEDILADLAADYHFSLTASQREAVVNSLSSQDYYLIQGPPGTGKSFVLGVIILAELLYFKHRVIVIGPNHLAVNNVLGQVIKTCPVFPYVLKVGQGYNAPDIQIEFEGRNYSIQNCPRLNMSQVNRLDGPWLFGMTPHSMYTGRAKNITCDTLIIDEAGQMSIPLALMGMFRAGKTILAGDHKQLSPIITSPDLEGDMSESVFEHLITDENFTLLDTSFRMCRPICDFVSQLFYEGKLGAADVKTDEIDAHPIELVNISDDGEQASDKEAEYISTRVADLLHAGIPASQIGILSPFRAQAANIRRTIRHNENISETDNEVIVSDTIDKMQGQERDVIFVSLTSGNPDYMSEMAEFLYSPNKLNVAFSRAKSKLIVVGNLDGLSKLNFPDYPHIDAILRAAKASC